MAILDQPMNMIDPANVPARPVGVRWGLIGGVGGIILNALFMITGLMKFGESSWIATLLSLGLSVAVCYMAIKQHRDEDLGGYISLGRCITLGLWIGLIAGIIGAVYIFIYTNFVNSNAMADAMEIAKQKMLDKGQSEEMADKAMGYSKMFMNPGVFSIIAILGSLFFYLLISLIEGLIMKKDPPYPA